MSEKVFALRAGEGEVLNVLGVSIRFLCGADQTGRKWSLMENVIPRDAGPPPHHHPWGEAYFLISGEVEFQIGDQTLQIRAGDFAYAPADTVHAFRGVSEEPSRMLVIDAPAHAENFFRDIDREVRSSDDGCKIPVIADRNKIYFVRA
jgi:quercetin dioxygenase-like cupin family protein